MSIKEHNPRQVDNPLPARPVVITLPPPLGPQPPNLLLGTLHLNDDGNSRRLLLLFGEDLRYCKARKKRLIWDTRRWLWDEKGEAFEWAKRAMRLYVHQAAASVSPELDFAIHSRNATRIRALLEVLSPTQILL